jgi:putative peptidoglycan lipid II flippase
MLADTATVGVWTAVAKALGALKFVVAARLFGTGDAMDAYLIAFLLPSFVADVMAGPLELVLVPALIQTRDSQGRQAAEALYSKIARTGFLALAIVACVLAVAAGPVVSSLGAGFHADKLAYTRFLALAMLPVIPLSAIWVAARSVLNAERHFAIAAVLPVITPLLSILAMAVGGTRWGVTGLAVATTAGTATQAAVCMWAAGRDGFRIRVGAGAPIASLRNLAHQYMPAVTYSIVMGASVLLDQAFSARLPSGSVSTLNYGTRLSSVLMSLGPMAVGTVVLPHASRLIAEGRRTATISTLRRYTAVALAACCAVVVLLMAASEPLVRMILRGTAVAEPDLRLIAAVQTISLLQVPAAILLAVGTRLISASNANRILYGLALVGLASTFVLDLLFMRWWGLIGITIAGISVRIVSVLYVFCKIRSYGSTTLATSCGGSVP